MKNIQQYIMKVSFAGMLMLLLFSSCKKSNLELGDSMGEPICASENFAFNTAFTISNATANFTASPYYITFFADMNENVEWSITITGQTSGAVKTYSGRSKIVSGTWYGNSDSDVFFTNETCNVIFQVACRNAENYTVTITNRSRFNTVFNQYILMCDYDGTAGVATGTWNTYQNAGATSVVESTNPSPQGGSYRHMYSPQDATGWYFGGFDSNVDLSTMDQSNPDSIYINLYVKGADAGSPVGAEGKTTVATVQFTDINSAKYKKNISVNWTGWKMISYPLSYFNIDDPSSITNIAISLGPYSYNDPCDVSFDFIIFSKNGTFLKAN